jgi:hypothetical protein
MEHGEVGIWHGISLLFWIIIVVIPFWKIFTKAGKSGWLSILMLVPLINLVILYYLAFSKWSSRG